MKSSCITEVALEGISYSDVEAVVNLIRRLPLSGNIQGNVRKITRRGSAVGMEERKAALR